MITLVLKENEIKPVQQAMREGMDKSLDHLEKELIKIRTGRAHTSLVEDILVSCYDNQMMPLKNIASITAPEANMIVIQPWDQSTLGSIEKAIIGSHLGITPINDGKIVRVQLPQMSSSRREELVKLLHKKLEECRVSIRNVRRDFQNLIRDAKKDKLVSENFFNRLVDVIQEMTDTFIEKAENIAKKKEQDITTV